MLTAKKIIKQITPPAVIKAGKVLQSKLDSQNYTASKFNAWWKNFSQKQKIDADLAKMMRHYLSTKEAQNSSRYWNYLSKKNIEQITQFGIENFKQTVATNYYTWINGISGSYGKNIVGDSAKYSIDISTAQLMKKHQFLTQEESILFNTMTALLYGYVKKETKYSALAEEAALGNSLSIEIEGKRVSQDILNSIIEFNSIVDRSGITPKSILEVGAGSGRTAEFFLRALPTVKYFIVDIPPALFVSQHYLSSIYPQKKVFKFRPFDSFEQIKAELEGCSLAFFSPDQLQLLPKKFVDLFLAIDCLHEMKPEQIKIYFEAAQKVAAHFYFKAWHDTTVPFDNKRLVEKAYPIPSGWKKIYHQDCYIPGAYFEAYYRISE